ncbi:FAD-dependent oxidoreductase [Angustibacter aerolatus]
MTVLPASADVVVVGAGLAGLTAAATLTAAGVETVLLEASDEVGGRVRTDEVDGLLLDRGFQLLNPAYPAARRLLDLDALDLQSFDAGVVVAHGGRRSVLADPLRSPRYAARSLRAPGSLREKLAFARWAGLAAARHADRLKDAPDEPYGATLRRNGIDGALARSVVQPFLAGVLGEDEGETSRRFVELVIRSFVRGTPALPARGVRAVPEQLRDRLPPGVLHLGVRAVSVRGGAVVTDAGVVSARCVVVAGDAAAASELTGLPSVPTHALTTFYHLAEQSPAGRLGRLLHLDGDRRGPVVNTAVVSDVAPTYAAGRGALVSSTVLGDRDEPATEQVVRAQLRLVYGVDPRGWQHVRTVRVPNALPAMRPPLAIRQAVDLGEGLFVAGDHRDTASVQGALVSGRRAARAVLAHLGVGAPVRATATTTPTGAAG